MAAPKNQGFGKLQKFPREGKGLGKNNSFGYIAYVGMQDVVEYDGEKGLCFSCCYQHFLLSVRQGNISGVERHRLGEF